MLFWMMQQVNKRLPHTSVYNYWNKEYLLRTPLRLHPHHVICHVLYPKCLVLNPTQSEIRTHKFQSPPERIRTEFVRFWSLTTNIHNSFDQQQQICIITFKTDMQTTCVHIIKSNGENRCILYTYSHINIRTIYWRRERETRPTFATYHNPAPGVGGRRRPLLMTFRCHLSTLKLIQLMLPGELVMQLISNCLLISTTAAISAFIFKYCHVMSRWFEYRKESRIVVSSQYFSQSAHLYPRKETDSSLLRLRYQVIRHIGSLLTALLDITCDYCQRIQVGVYIMGSSSSVRNTSRFHVHDGDFRGKSRLRSTWRHEKAT